MTDPITRLNAALEGRYHIESELGEGGMATVYLADDLKHERKVALKVLKPELAAVVGAERFLAEIKTTANLQHPHILPLFDSGEADSFLFYVMPYVEGETLRERIDREHQLPVDEAVQIATNVAEALDYAHKQGVIHRDIKPANILLQAGKPVISDFGIALAVGAAGGGRLTETGLSLGTPHYMSPEQATGDLSVGAATDVYALGCVLYEMLVGGPPYTGSTAQAILGKIIAGKLASVTEARASVPANVDAAIRKALEKLPADRFTGAQELAKALAEPGFRHGELAIAGSAATVGPWKRLAIATSAVAGIAVVIAAAALLPPEPPPVARFSVTPAEYQFFLTTATGTSFALSPDGSRIVFVGMTPGGGRQLWQRALEDLEAAPLPGTEGATAPVLSPDGRSVAFRTGPEWPAYGGMEAFPAGGAIRTVSLASGRPPTLVASGVSGNPAWGSDGMIYFTRENIIYRVAATGGEPEAVTTPTEVGNYYSLDVLPDGRGLLLTVQHGGAADSRIAVAGPELGEVREILTGYMARYAASGHIVYVTGDGAMDRGTLMAAPFDVRSLEVTGPSVAFVEGVRSVIVQSQFALSESGTLLYETGERSPVAELVWVSRDGQAEPVDPAWTGAFNSPALSPDGTRLAVSIQGETSMDVWIKELDRGPRHRLTFEGSPNYDPTWTPDGGSVTYSAGSPEYNIHTQRWNGSDPVLEHDAPRALFNPLWSPDGEWLVSETAGALTGAGDILALRPGQDTVPVPLVATEFAEHKPTLSPDGRWLAYESNVTGTMEIYVMPFPSASGERWPVSTGGGTEPLWSRTDREIFYRNAVGDMVSVRVETEPTFSIVGPPSVLFPATEYLSSLNFVRGFHMYDITPDGQRFIMLRPPGGEVQAELILVQNFFEELRQRVPELKPQIPWLRVFVEGVVIVGSILLAFGIDAAWEGRQERADEGRYITALLDEAYGAADELEIDRQARDGRLAALDSLQVYFASGRGRPDAFTAWVNESSSLANFFPPTAAYDDLVSSGGLQLLRSDELRLALMSYHQERPRLQFLEERERIMVDDDLRPYLIRNFPLDVEAAPASAISRLAGDQEFRSLIEVRRRRLTTTIHYQNQLAESLARLTETLARQANPN